jgi:hypothetical protein
MKVHKNNVIHTICVPIQKAVSEAKMIRKANDKYPDKDASEYEWL